MSSSDIKPIKLWGTGLSPNPFKVAILIKELGLPCEPIEVPYSDVKKAEYLAVNPNGRLPAIHDPNTGITLWESGAIIEYLVERYDGDRHRLSFAAGTADAYHARQWLYFQATGQGPYYGQLAWFTRFHAEKLPSAIERYTNEIGRVTGVLEAHLAQQKQSLQGDGPWLVGNKCSYADLAFLPWQRMASMFLDKEKYDEKSFPHVTRWLANMGSRDAVKAATEEATPKTEEAKKS